MRVGVKARLRTGYRRRVLAALFLMFLFAEFGGHPIAHAIAVSDHDHSTVPLEAPHEDDCDFAFCNESDRRNQPQPYHGHSFNQYATLADAFAPPVLIPVDRTGQLMLFNPGQAISRPPDLPFHPPRS